MIGRALLLCAVLHVVAPAGADDGKRPQLSRQGCAIAADMVLVARSLSEAGVERAIADKVMALTYAVYAEGGVVDRLRGELTALAFTRKDVPSELAAVVARVRTANQGALDSLLGSPAGFRGGEALPRQRLRL